MIPAIRTSKIIYCNGITTTNTEAQAICNRLQEITGQIVDLHHNDSTPSETVSAMVIMSIIGIGGVGHMFGSEKKTHAKTFLDMVIVSVAIVVLVKLVNYYINIQKEKNILAERLVGKIYQHLNESPYNHVTLILHSQGADIGNRALPQLQAYKNRINVVTAGGMVPISNHLANRVVNFQNDSDLVSKVANWAFDYHPGAKNMVTFTSDHCFTLACHGSADYEANTAFQATIQHFARMA